MGHLVIHWLALLEFLGLILTTGGALLLAWPTLSDISRRLDQLGLAAWGRGASDKIPGSSHVTSAGDALERQGAAQLPTDLRRVRWGIWLIVVGLVLTIPIKFDAAWDWKNPVDPPARASAMPATHSGLTAAVSPLEARAP